MRVTAQLENWRPTPNQFPSSNVSALDSLPSSKSPIWRFLLKGSPSKIVLENDSRIHKCRYTPHRRLATVLSNWRRQILGKTLFHVWQTGCSARRSIRPWRIRPQTTWSLFAVDVGSCRNGDQNHCSSSLDVIGEKGRWNRPVYLRQRGKESRSADHHMDTSQELFPQAGTSKRFPTCSPKLATLMWFSMFFLKR